MSEQVLMSQITPAELARLITEGVRDEVAKLMSINRAEQTQESEEEFLTIKEACNYLKCSTAKLWRLRRDGEIPYITSGRTILISKSDLDSFIKSNRKKGGQDD
ncbi:helix-turn-helix domain-containing protein [uncultured Psychroserpens sp.]|uniref:helix-turn-helix domain-containing protein n=1 Tax=uncultured Psychroserpens sp. TaxID=255436 RepID=UPI0026122172|nr:helix-turn-helix domain-containing protein [uncultured Psychroserpens sp.]